MNWIYLSQTKPGLKYIWAFWCHFHTRDRDEKLVFICLEKHPVFKHSSISYTTYLTMGARIYEMQELNINLI